jgi:cytochrome c oxidase subunit 3
MSREDSFMTVDMRDLFKHTVLVRHPLEEQFRDFEHQGETASFGMWLFLATEVMFFGALFLAVGVSRYMHPVAFEAASQKLNWQIATINTLVLLASSLMMVLAVHFARLGNRRLLVLFLLLTAALGAGFLGLKGFEYYIDYEENLIPGWRFDTNEWLEAGLKASQVPPVKLFLFMYWVMTAIHAIHMTVGITAVLILAWLAAGDYFSAEYNSPVDVVGLYWHFVDIVWIFLFPMLYLLGTHHW